MLGKLTLIPTPISNDVMLDGEILELLQKHVAKGSVIAVEEAKACRRRWIAWGLDRSAIENFVLYNEHTYATACQELLTKLKQGTDVCLMSDCGLPAFCDPGRLLVERCHHEGLKVTSANFSNSVVLALALSGFEHDRFVFEGFVARKGEQRKRELKRISRQTEVSILMDTPYRLHSLLEELAHLMPERECFLAMDLNKSSEQLIRAKAQEIFSQTVAMQLNESKIKKEFILILGGLT